MALNNLSKLNIFVLLVLATQQLTVTATNYISDNTVSQRDVAQQPVYSQVPQAYYIPYQKYIPANYKYIVPRPESQIQTTVSSTEKTLLSPYKVTVDTSKYVTSQVAKPTHDNQVSYPYLYTVAKFVPSTAATYTSPATYSSTAATYSSASAGSDYSIYNREEPKKYQFGYRVSNHHTGTEFGHSEVNDGHSAKGYYHVLLPDGRLQNVKYWAGPSGYHATITYETQY